MSHLEPVSLPAVAILGAGSMGRAILGGLRAPGVHTESIRVTGRDRGKLGDLEVDDLRLFATSEDPGANATAVRGAGIVIVAVKPAGVVGLLAEIAPHLQPGAVVISVAAGVTTEVMESALPPEVAVVRAMPNTPALVGRGVTGLSAGSRCTDTDLATASTLFETVGEVLVVPESQLDALSAVSGSGPAYVFLLIESLVNAAIEQGFSAEQARLLVVGTFRGAAELLVATGEDPAELRRRVTSPRGTTERAIEVLQTADLDELFVAATSAAIARAKEIAAESSTRR